MTGLRLYRKCIGVYLSLIRHVSLSLSLFSLSLSSPHCLFLSFGSLSLSVLLITSWLIPFSSISFSLPPPFFPFSFPPSPLLFFVFWLFISLSSLPFLLPSLSLLVFWSSLSLLSPRLFAFSRSVVPEPLESLMQIVS